MTEGPDRRHDRGPAATSIRFDHIAIATSRIADAPGLLVDALGGTPLAGAAAAGYTWAAWRYAGGGCLEVLEPRGDDGFLHRFLARRGPGVHHVTFRVPSLAAICARAGHHGYRIVGYDDSDPAWSEAFLHPKEALGIVVQFAESRMAPPSSSARRADARASVRIVGLRLRARSVARAQRQWADLLEGTPREADGTLVYRWPDSAMRLAVEIAPDAEEGPIAIEYASSQPVAWPAAAAVLGTSFRRVSV